MIRASLEGNGHKTQTQAYPNQGIDLTTRSYGRPTFSSLSVKYVGAYTPFGTAVADIVRSDRLGFMASRCGYCNEMFAAGRCRCHQGPTANVDDWTAATVSDAKQPRPTWKTEHGNL